MDNVITFPGRAAEPPTDDDDVPRVLPNWLAISRLTGAIAEHERWPFDADTAAELRELLRPLEKHLDIVLADQP